LLIKTAKDQGYHTLIAVIDADNLESIEFHKNFGFVEVDRIKKSGYKYDRLLDLFLCNYF
jgi:phosphinothricin acetyltransferase